MSGVGFRSTGNYNSPHARARPRHSEPPRDRGSARACGSAGRLPRDDAAAALKQALADGRAEIAQRLEAHPYAGSEVAAAYAFLTDQVLRLAYDYATTQLYPRPNPTASERLLLLAVGGYGRGEMALHSDLDIALVTPDKPVAWTEQAIEALLYLLWDLG
jgi:[protein-PII] uridylyltransferase